MVESMLHIESSVNINFNTDVTDSDAFLLAFFDGGITFEADIATLTAADIRAAFTGINDLVEISAGLDGLETAFDSIVAFTTVDIGDFCAGEYDSNENFASDLLCICKGMCFES